jgi:hypothetical protein
MEKPNLVYFYYKKMGEDDSFLVNLKLNDLLIDYELKSLGIVENYALEGAFITSNGKIKSTEKYIELKEEEMKKFSKDNHGKFSCFPLCPKPFDHKELKDN